MKTILITLALLTSLSSFATDLRCATYNVGEVRDEMKDVVQKVVNLKNIESTSRLDADLSDQNTLTPFETEKGLTKASFSNECDNMYEISFIANEFREISRKQRKEITGILTYNVNDGENQPLQALLKCTIK